MEDNRSSGAGDSRAKPQDRAEEPAESLGDGSSSQVLVVEDDPANALLIQTVLSNGGLTALATDNGEEIVRRARSGVVAVVVMDVSLRSTVVEGRKVDGLELTRIIRRESPRTVGVLLLTAHAMRGDRERFLEASTADGYMSKPIIDPDELVATVKAMIAGCAPT
jgi:CheY-like chemotaxis protein